MFRSPIPEASDEQWARFVRLMQTGDVAAVTPTGQVGIFQTRLKRLRGPGPRARRPARSDEDGAPSWTATFRPPLTLARLLADPLLQYRIFVASMKRYRDEVLARHRDAIGKEIEGKPATLSGLMAVSQHAGPALASWLANEADRRRFKQDDRGLRPHDGGVLMNAIARKPMDGAYRSWSDGRRVHLLVRFTGGNLGRGPVTMHATTDLAPARAAVRRHFVSSGDDGPRRRSGRDRGAGDARRRSSAPSGGSVARPRARRRSRPRPFARSAAPASTSSRRRPTSPRASRAPTALTAYATKPLGWRPGKKRGGPAAAAAPADRRAPGRRPTPKPHRKTRRNP